jgi:acetyl esterase/lipase
MRTHPTFSLSGLLLHFGVYDLSCLPTTLNYTKSLVLNDLSMAQFIETFLPNISLQERKDPSISPFYADLEKMRGKLPSALFTVGTEDCLMDDTVMMGTKWLMAGGEAVVKIYPGACHGFLKFDPHALAPVKVAKDDITTYIRGIMSKY